ncbi:MAG: fasciclin domain-containing protein [Aquisalinus sp.]|nr:fasciclin domain-containing protein [Aquisalinus sp.]
MKRVLKLTAAIVAATGLTTVAIAGTYAGKTEVAAKADIVDTAVANGSFNTLVAAVQAAGLEQTLRSEGPFTVFAPTDAAFAALPSGTVETLLLPENKDQLVSILTYHVVGGKVLSTDLQDDTQAVTVNGAKISIDLDNGVTINDADVIIADVKTSNGVIHVIDKVLLPPKHH